MENIENYETYSKKVKLITGATPEEVIQKAEEFEKNNKVIRIIQRTEMLIIIFYWGREDERRVSN